MENHRESVFADLQGMGFPLEEIQRAWNGSDIKTTEGLINYIDKNPGQSDVKEEPQE